MEEYLMFKQAEKLKSREIKNDAGWVNGDGVCVSVVAERNGGVGDVTCDVVCDCEHGGVSGSEGFCRQTDRVKDIEDSRVTFAAEN